MRDLTVAVTVDDKLGVAFNNRRQSRDRMLIENLLASTDKDIYVSSYSAPLFDERVDRIKIVSDPIKDCPDGGFCFIELSPIKESIDDISALIVYRWNKVYPSDKKLGVDLSCLNLTLSETVDFVGKSHDKITKEIYVK